MESRNHVGVIFLVDFAQYLSKMQPLGEAVTGTWVQLSCKHYELPIVKNNKINKSVLEAPTLTEGYF